MSEQNKSKTTSSWFANRMDAEEMKKSDNSKLFQERIQLIEDAVALKEGPRVPIAPMVGALPYFLDNTTYKSSMYDFPRASQALANYYTQFQPDATTHTGFTSGRANEIAGSNMIDWPGRPGTSVPDFSTHQVIEHEYMQPEEYKELLTDYTGFMLRKYIPRAFPALQGFSDFNIIPSIVLSTTPLQGLYSQDARDAYALISQIGDEDAKAAAASNAIATELGKLGFPPMMTGAGEAPFDIISDYFRGTLGALTDQLECPDEVEAACYMFADMQIKGFEYFKTAPLPVKRVFFPLHKGMDGFMSPQQYETLYWKPLKKVMLALIDMGVTPLIYGEGKYDSRVEQLADIPKGKVIYHFESVDISRAKKILGDTACISGNLPIYTLEFGTKQEVLDQTKRLIDICAPGGGYIFDTNACIDNAKRENVEAMFETVMTYGSK
ncbi:MAG: uroporphyrinogen decarboxylase family protein [Lachnospiraceae bacterium]